MMEQDFDNDLALGHESNGVEFKGPGKSTDKAFLSKIIRAVLGMANRRDGGRVIIGVEDSSLIPKGLDEKQLATWQRYDDISARINEYASPNVIFQLETPEFHGLKFAIIQVEQFDDIPILCAKDYKEGNERGPLILRRGACYVRARHKPETSEIPSEEEMRALLELAIDKGVQKFVTRARRAGLLPPMSVSPAESTDEGRFEQQIEEME